MRGKVLAAAGRAGLAAVLLLAGLAPAQGESEIRIVPAFLKSSHPESDRDYDYSTAHPSLGVGGPVRGQWLRWRAGMVRNSHSRWGPFAGLSGTLEAIENWRVGLNAGIAGNYTRNNWFRIGVLPIVQWKDPGSDLIWEFGFVRREDATFAGVGVHIPLSLWTTR
ncbi:MAG: hypothetical protein OXI22_19210 [Defluviicoccus sp.]|nr:hypothetical protein [Defluviicoccus sp.]MDE0386018.1 hypothetical protein [Defluviicoccus sp.]